MTGHRVDSPTRGLLVGYARAWSFARLLASVLLVTLLTPSFATAVPPSRHIKPSDTALSRLEQYEQYIAYFSSLRYGPMQSPVSPDYIRALILTESAAQKYAVSNKGARGLTQIMPETGRLAMQDILTAGFDYEYVDEEKLARYNADMLYYPCVNILIACYLGALYHADYAGRTDLVAAAWNAGPDAVAKYGNRIPAYRETRGMVTRLVGYLDYLSEYPISSTQPGQAPTTASAGVNWSDLSHSRWDTKGWTDPGWDEKKVNWELPF